MYKKLLTLLLTLVICLGLAAPALAAAGTHSGSTYSDVPASSWAAKDIQRATELGLFQGIGDGKFGRGQPITRAAFVTALSRLFRWEPVNPETPTFSDVTPDRWFYTAVETAAAHGALLTEKGSFRPSAHITREEMAVMLIRGMGYTSLAGSLSREPSPFTDVTVNRGFITVAYDMGIVSGVGDGKFAPKSTAVREQAAAMLVRVYDKLWAASQLTETPTGSVLSVATPAADPNDEMPITPLEPLGDLYTTLRDAKAQGMDLSTAVLRLTPGGVCTLVSNGSSLSTEIFSPEKVQEALDHPSAKLYYSPRYESAYCLYKPNGYQSATLWYQSDESLAAKLQLARLFDVTQYTFAPAAVPAA